MPAQAATEPASRHRPIQLLVRTRLPPDVLGLGALLALSAVLVWDRFRAERYLARTDLVTLFLTWHAYLGERLRAFDIPGWNPYQFGGAPFVGDPQSGWMYLPAMAAYGLLPPVTALQAFMAFHVVLAGLATYALGRTLGFGVLAATAAAAAYECAPLIENTRCCAVRAFVQAWLPVALLGVELAVRARSWPGRIAGWSVAGLAISQILAGWIGQGAYYGLLVIGAWLGYRTLVDPPNRTGGWRRRAGLAIGQGAAVLAAGFGLAAAGLVPRLLANRAANLAGGDYGALLGGEQADYWELGQLVENLLGGNDLQARAYLGGAVLALVGLAPFLAGRRYAVPGFAALSVAILFLLLPPTTILHRLVFLLPAFERLHAHVPSRITGVWAIGAILLAGAAVAALSTGRHRPLAVAALVGLELLLIASADRWIQTTRHASVPWETWATMLAAGAAMVSLAILASPAVARRSGARATRGLIGALLLLAIVWDPVGRQIGATIPDSSARLPRDETVRLYAARTDPGGAGAFLQARLTAEGPFRFFGYDAGRLAGPNRSGASYHGLFREPEVAALLAVARAVPLALFDVQGYNAIQRQRYVEWLTAVNDRASNYHDGYVLAPGLSSPLVRLLNARYVVVPLDVPPGRPDLLHLSQRYPTVYADEWVRVLEVTDALPRAWIVHDARHVPRGEALRQLANGAVDPSQVALLEEAPPPLARPVDGLADQAIVTELEPDRIVVRATTGADGLLVLSEVYDAGWTARVDGAPAPVLVANHLLRAVPLPVGTHVVELRYEAPGLTAGLAITLGTASVLAGALLVTWIGRRQPAVQGARDGADHRQPRLTPPPQAPRPASLSPRPARWRRLGRPG